MPEGFRVTSIGSYHLRRWAGDFQYLDGMVFDTPIFDSKVAEQIGESFESFDIIDRYDRALNFRTYLSNVWSAAGIQATYFDWTAIVNAGQSNFENVRRAIDRIIQQRERGGPWPRPGRRQY